jgi:HK97 family phage prohead protease|nr:MAG TPA: prohead serine protease [Caudoviricetes sp.]
MDNSKKREVRYMTGERFQPKIREAEDGDDSRVIEGYAIVFGVESRMLVDYWDNYREIIEPGAITEDDLKRMDIKMTLWHNRERLLARWKRGEGSLLLSVDEVGVKYRFAAPLTQDGTTALELVKRGDLAGSSFTYWSDESSSVRYTKDNEDVLLRHVTRIDEVFEMTIASDPAYVQTSVTAREVEASGIVLHPDNRRREIIENETAYAELRKIASKKIF